MKNIWAIWRSDLRRARLNIASIVIVIGLVIIPSLFTWFNVAASWDPFSNTKNLSFAVANTDEGYKSELLPMKINVGDEVLSALRANDQLHWVITSESEAVEGTRSGQYYAAVVIPKDFSRDMLTFFSEQTPNAQIIYFTNEKKNGLAPKITGQGAQQLSHQVNEVFAKTIADVGVNLLATLTRALSDEGNQQAFHVLDRRLEVLSQRLSEGANGLDSYASLVGSTGALIADAQNVVQSVGEARQPASQAAGEIHSSVQEASAGLDASVQVISQAIEASVASLNDTGTKITELYDALGQQSEATVTLLRDRATAVNAHATTYRQLASSLEQMNAALPGGGTLTSQAVDTVKTAASRLEGVSSALNDWANAVETQSAQVTAQRAETHERLRQAQQAVADLKNEYSTHLSGQINDLVGRMRTSVAQLQSARSSLQLALGSVGSSSGDATQKVGEIRSSLGEASSALREASQRLTHMRASVNEALNSGDVEQLRRALGENPEALASALAAPVGLDTRPVFPVENFGSAMAPFYAVLALWVGTLLMCVTIRTDVSDEDFARGMALLGRGTREVGGEGTVSAGVTLGSAHAAPGGTRVGLHRALRPFESFLGRYGIFAVIALAQSTVVCAGNLYFLKIQSVHPLLYMCAGWLISLVFSFLMYTLVASLGNAGKALGVFLLVVQITGAGGAFPLQILPPSFAAMSPFLPATYGITAMRAAIAGYAGHEFWGALGTLMLFVVPMLLIGLVLRPFLLGRNRAFVAKLEETKVL